MPLLQQKVQNVKRCSDKCFMSIHRILWSQQGKEGEQGRGKELRITPPLI